MIEFKPLREAHSFFAPTSQGRSFNAYYVAAKLRERKPHSIYRNKTLASRLPTWIKLAKNRESVLKCISELKKQIRADRKASLSAQS